nr:hypothetical protein [Nocardioides alcanivorans]
MVDDADHEEQAGLEQGVGEQHRETGQGGRLVADAEHHQHEAELAHGAVGQEQLDVVLPQRTPAAEQHGDDAEPEQGAVPAGDTGEGRSEQGDEIDAGLHHRGGMQIGADRRGGGHGAGQPEVEGEEGRLADCSDEQQDHRSGGPVAVRWVGEDVGDPVGAGLVAEHQHADEHRQATEGGDDQCLHGRESTGPLLGVGADQQVGEDRGEFPEDIEQEQVVGEHQPEHRPGEAGEDTGEHRQDGIAVVEVVGAIAEDEHADAADHQRHEPLQRAELEGDLEVESSHPGEALADHLAVADPVGQRDRPAEGRQRRQGHEQERTASHDGHRGRAEGSQDEVGEEQLDQVTGLRSSGRRSRSFYRSFLTSGHHA